jgi:predicted nucleotidyltransferase
LDHLVDHGLVTVQPAGRANLYTLNRDHLAIPAVEAALGMRVTLADRIRQAVEAWHPAAIHLSIFGSMARGDGDIHSDIDLLIVRLDADVDDPQWRSQVALLQQDIERWTGNRAAPMDLSVADLKEMDRSNRPVLADIRKDGFLIHGREIDDLLLEHQLVRSVAGS